jgi:hypothetical protein
LVDETRAHLEARYGQDWLYESIGTSETPLQAVKTDWPGSAWSGLVTNSLRRAVNADIGIDFAEFNGKAVFLPGVITREHIMTLYPRTFDVTDPMGWRVWKGKATGAMIELAVRSSLLFRYGLFFSGITFEPGKNKIYINGKLLRKYKTYTLAMPEGIAKGSQEMHALLKLIIHGAEPTEIPMWTAIENEIKLNSPIREKTF